MATKVTNQTELAIAMSAKAPEIIIEGDLAKKILKIRATGNVAWVISIAMLLLVFIYGVDTFGILKSPQKSYDSAPVSSPYTTGGDFPSAPETTGTVHYKMVMPLEEKEQKFSFAIIPLLIAIGSAGIAILLANKYKNYFIKEDKDKLTLNLKSENMNFSSK